MKLIAEGGLGTQWNHRLVDERFGNYVEEGLWLERLDEDLLDADLLRDAADFWLEVMGCLQDDGRRGGPRVGAYRASHVVPIDAGHDEVDDDQVWLYLLDQVQPSLAVGAEHGLVTRVLKERRHQLAVGRAVFDNDYGGHQLLSPLIRLLYRQFPSNQPSIGMGSVRAKPPSDNLDHAPASSRPAPAAGTETRGRP